MNIIEYNETKEMNYLAYCDYLQNKYGIGLSDYMTQNWNIKPSCKRTKDGLYAHHKFENQASKLSDVAVATLHPFEWQKAKNIVYCDLLEHLFLHILIAEESLEKGEFLGFSGIMAYLIPELNDVYSGWETKQPWRKACHQKIIDDKNVYLALIKRFKTNCAIYPFLTPDSLCSSYNKQFGQWDIKRNSAIFEEISAL